MTNLLDYLSKDNLPDTLINEFIAWCVWEQTRPALMTILQKTGLIGYADEISRLNDYATLALVAENAGKRANEARKHTSPLGISTAEAASFLAQKIGLAAADGAADDVAFFAAQVCGWQGFAETNFANPTQKQLAEDDARTLQAKQLAELWQAHGITLADDTATDDDFSEEG